MKKRFLSLCVALACAMSMSVTAGAVDSKLWVSVNERPVMWREEEPFINADDRTMVPLAVIADAIGVDVTWDAERRTAIFKETYEYPELCPEMYHKSYYEYATSVTVEFAVDSKEYRVITTGVDFNGTYTMDTAATISNDRIFAPVAFLAQAFGYRVTWDGETNSVKLYDDCYYTETVVCDDVEYPYYVIEEYDVERMAYIYAEVYSHGLPGAYIYLPFLKNGNEGMALFREVTSVAVKEKYYGNAPSEQGIVIDDNGRISIHYSAFNVYKHESNPFMKSVNEETLNYQESYFSTRQSVYAAAWGLLSSLYSEGRLSYNMSERERANIIRNALCEIAYYSDVDGMCHSAGSIFYRGYGVCTGFASAYNLLLEMDGIECRIQSGKNHEGAGGHVWCVAILDGEEWHIEPTNNYDYTFCMNDKVLSDYHGMYDFCDYIWY